MTEVIGRGGDGMNVARRGARGGTFDALTTAEGAVPGQPAQSVEGWVVFASNLHPETSESDLKDLFGDVGSIRKLKRCLDTRGCQCIGHALVEFGTYEEAAQAVVTLTGTPFVGDLPVRVDFAFVTPAPSDDAAEEAGPAKPEKVARAADDEDDAEGGARKTHHAEAPAQ